jgi:hypothetical protein
MGRTYTGIAHTYLYIALNSLRGANNVVDLNPARVKAQEEVQDLF